MCVGVYVDCGSKYESAAQQGASHLLERMAFKGTANRSHLRFTREVEAIGANLLVSAAREQTSYTADVLKGHFAEAVELLADIVVNPKVKPHELVQEVRRPPASQGGESSQSMSHAKGTMPGDAPPRGGWRLWQLTRARRGGRQMVQARASVREMAAAPTTMVTEGLHTAAYKGGLGNPFLFFDAAINPEMLMAFQKENYTGDRVVVCAAGVDHAAFVGVRASLD